MRFTQKIGNGYRANGNAEILRYAMDVQETPNLSPQRAERTVAKGAERTFIENWMNQSEREFLAG